MVTDDTGFTYCGGDIVCPEYLRLTNAQLSALLEGWDPSPPVGCGLSKRDMLFRAMQNRINLGRLSAEDIARAA